MSEDRKRIAFKRNVLVKTVVTHLWKQEMLTYLGQQVASIDQKLEEINAGETQAIAAVNLPTDSPEGQGQINLIRATSNEQRSQVLAEKNKILANVQAVHNLGLGEEVEQMQLEGIFDISEGENLIGKLNSEIILNDGVVVEIRNNG